MSSHQSFLLRHRAAIVAITTTAAVLSIIALSATQRQPRSRATARAPLPLRRSNAVRRSRRLEQSVQTQAPSSTSPLGTLTITSPAQDPMTIRIGSACIPSRRTLATLFHTDTERTGQIYELIVTAAVKSILALCADEQFETLLPHGSYWGWMYQLRSELHDHGVEEAAASKALTIARFIHADDPALVRETILSSAQDENEGPDEHTTNADQLKEVLYYIAEEQAKRKAYVHRGIRCEECGENPIRNVRWHCLNCADFDLCATCKTLTTHQKNHILAEIRTPIPVLAQPSHVLPLWYPGDGTGIDNDNKLSSSSRLKLLKKYGFDEVELDALLDQFCCLTDGYRLNDPLGSCIRKEAFQRAMCPDHWRTRWHSNMIADRTFSFYDTEDEGEISFESFVSGMAYVRGKNRFASLDRAVKGFDLEDDGLIGRDHFIQLLRAKFDAHRVLLEEIADNAEAENTRRILPFRGTQPIGTVFQGDIPEGAVRDSSGKVMNQNGDLVPSNDRQIILDNVFFRATGDEAPTSTKAVVTKLSKEERRLLGLETQSGQDRQHRQTNEALIWDIIEASIHETLDKLYKPAEARMARVLATKDERTRWHNDIQRAARERMEFAEHLESGADLDPLLATANKHHSARSVRVSDEELTSLEHSLREGMVPTDSNSLEAMETELEKLPLQTLLDSSGYAVMEENESVADVSRPDPTMPQNRPNASDGVLPPQLPSWDRLKQLADIESEAQGLHIRNGRVYLESQEIEALARADQSKELEGLIKSWLTWAAF